MRLLAGGLNRTWLAIIGFVLLIVAAAIILTATGVASGLVPGWPGQGDTSFSGAQDALAPLWVPVAVLLVALVLAALAIAWLVRQYPRRLKAAPLRFHRDARSGATIMDSSVLANAVAADAEGLAHVTRADAVLRGTRSATDLVLKVTVFERADVREVVDRIEDTIVPNAEEALGSPLASTQIEVAISRESRGRGKVLVAEPA